MSRHWLPRRSAAWIAGTVLLVGLSIAAAQTAGNPPATTPNERGWTVAPPAGALLVGGTAPDLELLYTGDVIGYVDPAVGFVFHKKVGDPVAIGEPIVTVHFGPRSRREAAIPLVKEAIAVAAEAKPRGPLVIDVLT